MTLAEYRTHLTKYLEADLDNFYGESPAPGELTAQVNWAYATVARRVGHYAVGVALSLTANVWTYALNAVAFAQPMVAVEVVRIGGVPLLNWREKPGLFSQSEMDATHEGWQAGGVAGTVEAASQIGNTLYVFPKPSGSITAHVDGYAMPVALVADGDVSVLPLALDQAIVALAAIYAATPQVTEEEGMNRLKMYDAAAAAVVAEYAQAFHEVRVAKGSARTSRMAGL